MTEPRGASVVIVGGGATGLSAGWWLARDVVDALVIDKGIVGWEASGRNGGGCTHPFSPLFKEEQRLWPMMDELLGYPTEFRPQRIRLALDEEQMRRYGQARRHAVRQGFVSEALDAGQVRALVPLAGDNVVGGYLHHFGGHANPQRTVQAYAWAMQDHGGRVLQHTTVQGFATAGGKVTEVHTDRGSFGCDVLVIAAGPQINHLAASLGVHVPMVASRAEMIVTEPLPLMPIGGVDGNGLYGRQTQRGNLAYGGGPHEWIEIDGMETPPRVTTPLLRHLGRRLAEMFPKAAHVRIIRSWGGIVENTPDGRPVVERLDNPDNVVIATMSSIGFGLSPATGRVIKELIVDGGCSFADLRPISLARFNGLPRDWRERLGWLPAAEGSAAA